LEIKLGFIMPLRALLLLALLFSPFGHAAETLQLSQAWVRATPPNAQVAGAFLQIENTSDKPERLLSVHSPLAERIEMHEMRMDGDLMQMRELTDGLSLPAKSITTLKPGGIHLMLIAPKRALAEGQSIRLTLVFENAGKRTLTFNVYKKAPGATAASEHHH
jgi:periplasmic copper chaperone A